MAGTAGEEFCRAHNAKISDLVAFLANARSEKLSYNKTFTRLTFALRRGDKRVFVRVPIVDADPKYKRTYPVDEWKDDLIKALLLSFGLMHEYRSFRWPQSWGCLSSILEELRRRGGKNGFDLVGDAIQEALDSGEPQQKRDARKRQAELNRALAHLRKARKLGATARQMTKLVRTILGEEAVMEVQTT